MAELDNLASVIEILDNQLKEAKSVSMAMEVSYESFLSSLDKPVVKKLHHNPELHEFLMAKLKSMKNNPIILVDQFKAKSADPKEAIEEYEDSEDGYETRAPSEDESEVHE